MSIKAGTQSKSVGGDDRIATASELNQALDSVAILLIGSGDEILHWSRGCERLLGWTADEAIGRKYQQVLGIAPEESALRLPAPGETSEVQRMLRRRDGSEVCVLKQINGIAGDKRDGVFVVSLTDITERTATEAALRRSEERLAEAVAAHEVSVFEWDVASGRLSWSPGSEQRLGLEPGGLSSLQSWRAFVRPQDVRILRNTLAGGAGVGRVSFRYGFSSPDGMLRSIEGSMRCFYDWAGTLVRTVGAQLDVTDRDRREADLQSGRDQLGAIFDNAPDGMIAFDEAGTVQMFSVAAERLFGRASADVIGTDVAALIPAAAGANGLYGAPDPLLGIRPAGGARTMVGVGAAGAQLPIEVSQSVAVIGGERLFTAFVRDISERLAAEERQTALRDELSHLGRLHGMGEIVSSIAHELNQPLSAAVNFLGAAEMLTENGSPADEVADLIRMASQQTLRAGDIIRRVRGFVSSREVEASAEPVRETIEDAVALLLGGRARFEVGLVCGFAPAASRMLADRIQVQQVIVNLMRNAMDAMRDQPREAREIAIATRVLPGGLIEIEVGDTGPGIESSLLERLGTPLVSDKPGGLGIGLAICRRIVEAHGGTLHAENRPQGGATFRFTIPEYRGSEVQP